LLKRGVASVADDEGAEDGSDTGSRSGDTDGGGASTDVLGGGVNVLRHRGGLDTPATRHAGALPAADGRGSGGGLHPECRGDGLLPLGQEAPGAVGSGDAGEGGHPVFFWEV